MINQIIEDAKRFSAFLVANYPQAREWEDPVAYCAWYIGRGYTAAVVDGDEIVALCAMRPVERPGFGVLPFYFNENGDCLHIDLLVDTTNDERASLAFKRLFDVRFGQRKWVTAFRGTEESIHVKRYKGFWRKLAAVKRAKKENRNGIKK